MSSASEPSTAEPSTEGGTVTAVRAAPEGYVSPKLLQRQQHEPQEQAVDVIQPNLSVRTSAEGLVSMGTADCSGEPAHEPDILSDRCGCGRFGTSVA